MKAADESSRCKWELDGGCGVDRLNYEVEIKLIEAINNLFSDNFRDETNWLIIDQIT